MNNQARNPRLAPVLKFRKRPTLHLVGHAPSLQQIPDFVFRTDLGWRDYWFRYSSRLNLAKISATAIIYGLMYLVWLVVIK